MTSWTALGTAAGLTAALFLAGCGGRAANPVQEKRALDTQASCSNLEDQKSFNTQRIADLRDERVENRTRSLSRLPGAIIGNPISAIALADTSRAIYTEIEALEKRNIEIDRQYASRSCAETLKAQPPVSTLPERVIVETDYNTLGSAPEPAPAVDDEPVEPAGLQTQEPAAAEPPTDAPAVEDPAAPSFEEAEAPSAEETAAATRAALQGDAPAASSPTSADSETPY